MRLAAARPEGNPAAAFRVTHDLRRIEQRRDAARADPPSRPTSTGIATSSSNGGASAAGR